MRSQFQPAHFRGQFGLVTRGPASTPVALPVAGLPPAVKRLLQIIGLGGALCTAVPGAQGATHVIGITPSPGALHQLPAANIVVQFDGPIDPVTVSTNSFRVAGEVSGSHPGSFAFALGDTQITFIPSVAFARGETVSVTASSQIKDAPLDAAITPWVSQFIVLNTPGAAEFAQGATSGVGERPFSMAAYDLDGDGKLDLVVANSSIAGSRTAKTVSVLRGQGDGTFGPKTDYPTDPANGAMPAGVFVGDFDRDGDGDIAAANYASGTLGVLRNDGSGGFGPPQIYPVNGSPMRVTGGDLDGDGFLDLVVSLGGLNGDGDGVNLFFGQGDGTFEAAVHLSTGQNAFGVALGDVNGDGFLDIATANTAPGSVSVLQNLGHRMFAAAVSLATGIYPRDVVLADLNGDGAADLLVANQSYVGSPPPHSAGSVSIYRNAGNGSFSNRKDYEVNGLPVGLTAGDFNGDGLPDFATANHYGGNVHRDRSVSVWINSGSGAFDLRKDLNAGASQPIAIGAADLDNDGDLDLFTANWSGNSISFLKNAPASLTGLVYRDADGNCTRNGAGEYGVAGRLVRLTDSSGAARFTMTQGDGTYAFVAPVGAYTLSLVHNAGTTELCNGGQGVMYPVTVTQGVPVTGRNFGAASTCQADVSCVSIVDWPCPTSLPAGVTCEHASDNHRRTVCPCEPFHYAVTVQNSGSSDLAAGAVVQLYLPPEVMFCNFPSSIATALYNSATVGSIADAGQANPNPACNPDCNANTGQTVQWTLNAVLPAGASCTFYVNVQVANVPVSTVLYAVPALTATCDGGAISAIGTFCSDEVKCSFDPNDKTVSPAGCGPSGNVPPGTALTYRTRFQNLGTAAARRVMIRDFLDPALDPGTLEILSTSHSLTKFEILPGGETVWTFDNIHLADAASDEPGSRGEVRYRVRPMFWAGDGTTILNSAAIYFDLNDPVLTASTTTTIRTHAEPAADFTAHHSDTQAGLVYDFTYAGNTPDGAAYAWNFGPDATPALSTDRNPSGIRFSTPGPKQVTLTLQRYGCTASAMQTVQTVFIPLLCPSNIVAQATSPAGAPVVLNVSAVSLNCAGPVTVECVPPSGSLFAIGRTVVNCIAYDACGATNICSFPVDVVRPPVQLACPGNLSFSADNPAGMVVTYNVTAQSGCESNIAVQCSPPSGSLFPVGPTTVTCTAVDACGSSNQCSFVVQVALPPQVHLTCPPSFSVTATNAAGAMVFYQIEAVSDCGPSGLYLECWPPSGSLFPIGQTTVDCTAYDFDCDLTATCSFDVQVLPPGEGPVWLAITRAGAGFVLSWPDPSPGFRLQSTSTLLPSNWADVALPVIVVGNQRTVTVPAATSQNQFYRLLKP